MSAMHKLTKGRMTAMWKRRRGECPPMHFLRKVENFRSDLCAPFRYNSVRHEWNNMRYSKFRNGKLLWFFCDPCSAKDYRHLTFTHIQHIFSRKIVQRSRQTNPERRYLYIWFNVFSAKGNIELFANNIDSGESARNELSHLKPALFGCEL